MVHVRQRLRSILHAGHSSWRVSHSTIQPGGKRHHAAFRILPPIVQLCGDPEVTRNPPGFQVGLRTHVHVCRRRVLQDGFLARVQAPVFAASRTFSPAQCKGWPSMDRVRDQRDSPMDLLRHIVLLLQIETPSIGNDLYGRIPLRVLGLCGHARRKPSRPKLHALVRSMRIRPLECLLCMVASSMGDASRRQAPRAHVACNAGSRLAKPATNARQTRQGPSIWCIPKHGSRRRSPGGIAWHVFRSVYNIYPG